MLSALALRCRSDLHQGCFLVEEDLEAVEVSEASDISGLNELSRRRAAQDGLRVGGLVRPSRRVGV